MVTIAIAKQRVNGLLADLVAAGYSPTRAVLFGSVAKGKAHALSDIDVAIWDEKFTGCKPIDYEHIARIFRKYPRLEVHTFNANETRVDNPFIAEIEKEGITIEVPVVQLPV
jgi:predicted nucleotidyltransferase